MQQNSDRDGNEDLKEIQLTVSRIEEHQLELAKQLAKKKGFSLAFDGDENEERGNWTGKFDFFLSCLGYAVGIGNVYRFPYLCYRNGGGAFFIPYLIFLFLCGMPVFCMELSLGQFCSSGPLSCWEFAPVFRGIGFGMVIVSAIASIYYNVVITWAIWYLFASFNSKLPWSECGEWSTQLCSDKLKSVTENCNGWSNLTAFDNGTCWFVSSNENQTSFLYGIYNQTLARQFGIAARTASNEYVNYVSFKDKLGDLNNMGPLRWDMCLCLLLSWVIVFLSLSKGIKSSGKVVYFTAIFPYVVLVILLVRGLTLPGYQQGLAFYLTPNMTRLGDSGVWRDAAVQIFFSLSASWGGLMTLASYNRFRTDAVRDAVIVALANCATSIFAGFVVFSFMGYLAYELNTEVSNVVDSGVALAFIVYPQALMKLPVSTFWAILFFLMLITLGLDSQFTLVETVLTGMMDWWPKLRPYKTLVILGLSALLFTLGLPMCTPGGPHLLQIFDDYTGGWNVMVITILECVAIGYVYGVRRFTQDIELMTGPNIAGCVPWRFCKWWWVICWCIFTPIILGTTMVFSWVRFTPSKYGDVVLPLGGQVVGWMLTLSVLLSIALWTLHTIWQFRKRPRDLIRPSRYWGPALVKYRQLVHYVEGFVVDPWSEDAKQSAAADAASEGSKGQQNPTYTPMEL